MIFEGTPRRALEAIALNLYPTLAWTAVALLAACNAGQPLRYRVVAVPSPTPVVTPLPTPPLALPPSPPRGRGLTDDAARFCDTSDAFRMTDERVGWALVGRSEGSGCVVARTDDGGHTWTRASPARLAIALLALGPKTALVAVQIPLLADTDGTDPLSGEAPSQPAIVRVDCTQDGGRTWAAEVLPETATEVEIGVESARLLQASDGKVRARIRCQTGSVKTCNFDFEAARPGERWHLLPGGGAHFHPPGRADRVEYDLMNDTRLRVGYFRDEAVQVSRSVNGGAWTSRIEIKHVESVDFAASRDERRLYLVPRDEDHAVRRALASDDGGAGWRWVEDLFLPAGNVHMDVDAGWVVVDRGAGDWRTIKLTAQPRTPTLDATVAAVCHPDCHMFMVQAVSATTAFAWAATESGPRQSMLLRTDDGGATWERVEVHVNTSAAPASTAGLALVAAHSAPTSPPVPLSYPAPP